ATGQRARAAARTPAATRRRRRARRWKAKGRCDGSCAQSRGFAAALHPASCGTGNTNRRSGRNIAALHPGRGSARLAVNLRLTSSARGWGMRALLTLILAPVLAPILAGLLAAAAAAGPWPRAPGDFFLSTGVGVE